MTPSPCSTLTFLFVCLGNICRSPAAEGVMVKRLQQAGLEGQLLLIPPALEAGT